MSLTARRLPALHIQPESVRGIEISDLVRILWRHRVAMALVAVLTLVLGYLVVHNLPKRYTAQASLVLEVANSRPVDVDSVVPGLNKDTALINSEIDVLRSRGLAERVVDDLALLADPEFNSYLRHDEPGLLHRLGMRGPAAPGSAETVSQEQLRTEIVDAILANLDVANDGESYTIWLTFEAASSEMAATVANAFADRYLRNRLESKHRGAERTVDWIKGKLQELRERATLADQAAQQFREQHGLVDASDGTLTEPQLARVSAELADAMTIRSRLEATLAAVRGAGYADGDWIDPESADAVLIKELRSQQSMILVQLAELRSQFGAHHPQIVAAENRLRELQAVYEQEAARIRTGLAARLGVARAQEEAVTQQLAELTQRRQATDRVAIQLRQLISEAEAARSLFNAFVSGLSRTSAEVGVAEADARILSRAVPPLGASFPPRTLLMLLSGLLAGLLALMTTAILELFDRSYRNPVDFERAHGLAVLGLIPLVRQRGTGAEHPSIEVIERPSSRFTDAVHTVYAALAYSTAGVPPKAVLVTSAAAGEGKTALAIALGRLAACSRKRVLLIDGDMRRPSVSKSLGKQRESGLVELMEGKAGIDQVLVFDHVSGMAVLPVARAVPFPGEILSSNSLRRLLERARQEFDLVIVDSPPVGIVADAAVLATLTDATLLTVRWGQTSRSAVAAALHNLEAIGPQVTAAVFSHVNMKRYASYGYTPLGAADSYFTEGARP
jgi:capsular exopolysaccharide synthesis family protein